uniref:MICOS complex subunit n=1 Tax=Bos indicus x Bos taurus TaxID=30522 RepID=A0A4W2I3R8_BOBOX
MAALRMGKLTTMPTGLIYASISVHVAKEEESKKQLVKPEQLPIYTAPPLQSKYVEEQPGHLQMGFASIRTTTSRYIGWCKGVYVFVKNGIMDTVQFGKDAYVYLKNPPRDFLPKIGVITVSGLAGFISARKGSRFKRIAYPLGLATLGATVCYPVQSVIIAKVAGKKAYATSQQMYEAVKSLWTKNNKKLPEHKEKTKLGSADETETPAETTHNLKHSVPLPAELSSETKTKSTSGCHLAFPCQWAGSEGQKKMTLGDYYCRTTLHCLTAMKSQYPYLHVSTYYLFTDGSVVKNPPAMQETQETWV